MERMERGCSVTSSIGVRFVVECLLPWLCGIAVPEYQFIYAWNYVWINRNRK